MTDDGLGEGINKFIMQSIAPLGNLYLEALKEQIDIESKILFENIRKQCPIDSGNLVNSLTMVKVDNETKYGYEISFGDGQMEYALALEHGTKTRKGLKFMAKATRQLKGIDKRAIGRFEKMASELEDK